MLDDATGDRIEDELLAAVADALASLRVGSALSPAQRNRLDAAFEGVRELWVGVDQIPRVVALYLAELCGLAGLYASSSSSSGSLVEASHLVDRVAELLAGG